MLNLTIGGWVTYFIVAVILCIISAGCGLFIPEDPDTKNGFIGFIIGIILSIITLFVFNWYYNSTASGARAIKTQESNLSMGIKRQVEVYDATGNLIKEYQGKFDIEYDDDRILFDDENGHRHIIYYPTGTVIIDEIE